MKLTTLIQQSNRSFASVFLAFSLFGFLFPHNAKVMTERHQANLRIIEQTSKSNTDDLSPEYEWFY